MELRDSPDQPWPIFARWFALAQEREVSNPEAMSLATLGAHDVPELRTVLMKDVDERGVVFFTNSLSTKGRDIAKNPNVALLFYWRGLERQVRMNGQAAPIAAVESDGYFASRNRMSKIGAWASRQSQPMDCPETLRDVFVEVERRYPDKDVPRPPHWFGYRVAVERVEFWIQEPGRLHQRIVYTRKDVVSNDWVKQWLFP